MVVDQNGSGSRGTCAKAPPVTNARHKTAASPDLSDDFILFLLIGAHGVCPKGDTAQGWSAVIKTYDRPPSFRHTDGDR